MKRKGILQFMKECLADECLNFNVSGNKTIKILLENICKVLYFHYELSDLEKSGNHQQRFFLLYMNKNEMTFNDISEATFVGFDTFKRYVKQYNRTALDFVMKRSQSDPDFFLLLQEYYASGF